MTKIANHTTAHGAVLPETELLQHCEQQLLPRTENNGATPKLAHAHAGLKHFPYARVDRSTIRRTKRLGPAFSLSTTRQIYPDEDSAADIAI